MIVFTTTLGNQIRDTIHGNYQETSVLIAYWCLSLINLVLMIYSECKDKPDLIRLVHLGLIVRNIMPLYNLEQRESLEDLGTVVYFSQSQNLCLISLLGCMQVSDPWYIHVPVSVLA